MELNGLGYDQSLGASITPTERRHRDSFPVEYAPVALTRTRTVGGEPNPERPPSPSPEPEPQDRKELAPPGLLSLEAIALLAPFSIFGLLARLGIDAIVSYPGQSVFPLAWVQAAGCFVMGLAQSQKPFIMTFYPPLYLGITTGFCGSLTTFAGWQRDVFLAWSEDRNPPISHWHRFIDGATRLFFTQAISIACLLLGESIGRHNLRLRFDIPPRKFRIIIVILSAISYVVVFPAFFTLSSNYRKVATAALLFGFPGALTRHLLGTVLNPRIAPFPLGTFTSNMLGTVVSSLAYTLQNIRPIECNMAAIGMLQGLSDGYAGCLSTVSTYAAEIHLMRRRHAWTYAIISWICAQLLLVLIIGSAQWSGALSLRTSCT